MDTELKHEGTEFSAKTITYCPKSNSAVMDLHKDRSQVLHILLIVLLRILAQEARPSPITKILAFLPDRES